MEQDAEVVGIVFLAAIAFALYFLPAIVAFVRNHHQKLAILMLNIFLGWTFIGWVISLVWAATTIQKNK